MESKYEIQYDFGWFFKKYWLTLEPDCVILLNSDQSEKIEIKYENIYHVIKVPVSFTALQISCHEDILENYPGSQVMWFPPRPLFTPWVFGFNIHSLRRDEILNDFAAHGVRTKLDVYSVEEYYKKVAIKSKEKLKNRGKVKVS